MIFDTLIDIIIILPSLSQSAWNTRFYFGQQKPCMDNNIWNQQNVKILNQQN